MTSVYSNLGEIFMRARIVLLSVVTALLAGAAFAPSASAVAFCLYPGTCYGDPTNAFPATEDGLKAAIAKATLVPTDDRIEIGANTIDIDSQVTIDATPTNNLAIEGVGGSASVLHFTQPSGPGILYNAIGTGASSITNLKVEIDGTTTGTRQALYLNGGYVTGVKFDVKSTDGLTTEGAVMGNNAICEGCEFNLFTDQAVGAYAASSATFNRVVFRTAGIGTENTTGLVTSGNATVNVSGSRFTELRRAVTFDGGTVNLRDSLIDMGDNNSARGVYVSNDDNNSGYTLVTNLDGVTVVGNGNQQVGLDVKAFTTNAATEHATANVTNSLFLMTGTNSTDLQCADDGGFGVGAIDVKYSLKRAASPTNSGCTSVLGSGNIDSDAVAATSLFVDYANGDLRPKPNAIVIDAGDPGTVHGTRSDALMAIRFVATIGVPNTIDPGGIEYQDYPPEKPSLHASATTVSVGQPIDFTASSTDANGDAITYSWDFSGEGSSTDQNPTHAFATSGLKSVTVQAQANGLGSEWSDTLAITVTDPIILPPPPGGGTTNPEPPATLSFTKPKCKFKSNKKAKNGFTVNAAKVKDCYLQSVSSRQHSYMFRLERVAAGYLVGGACKAKQGKSGKANPGKLTRCNLPLKGSQTIELPKGTSYLTFGGRWNNKPLPPGVYSVNGINPNSMPNRISMNVTVAKQGSTGRTK